MGESCAHCSATPASLLRCAGCARAAYCGRACQKKGWKKHRGECRSYRVEEVDWRRRTEEGGNGRRVEELVAPHLSSPDSGYLSFGRAGLSSCSSDTAGSLASLATGEDSAGAGTASRIM